MPIAVMVAAVAIPNLKYWPHGSPLDRASFNMFRRPSRFMQNGHPLPYVIQCVLNSTGPMLANPPKRPGTLVFAVSPDRKQAWFAATVLERRTDRHATWLTQQGQPRVIAFSVQEKS